VEFVWLESPMIQGLGEPLVAAGVRSLQTAGQVGAVVVDRLGGFATVGVSFPIAVDPETSTPSSLLELRRFTRDGRLQWLQEHTCFGGPIDHPRIVMTKTGVTLVAGAFTGTCSFGGTDLSSAVNPNADSGSSAPTLGDFSQVRGMLSKDLFLLGVDSLGEITTVEQMVGPGTQSASALAVSSASGPILLAEFEAHAEFGDQQLVSTGGATVPDSVAIELDNSGQIEAVHPMVGAGIRAAARIDDQFTVLTGVGIPPQASFWDAPERASGWVMAVADDLEPLWGMAWTPATPATGLVVDDEAAATLAIPGPLVQFDAGGTLTESEQPSTAGLAIVKIGKSGRIEWRRDLTGPVFRASLALGRGQLAVWGSYEQGVALPSGGELLAPIGARGAFLWTLDTSGETQSALALSGAGLVEGVSIESHPIGGWMALLWSTESIPSWSIAAGYHSVWLRF
jgi:hypothetical protein